MGINFSYLLYFQRQDLWHAMDGLLKMAEHHHPPTRILFPDHELLIPLDSWTMRHREVHHDDPEFSFATVLKFERDDAIEDWISRIGVEDDPDRAPPDPDDGDQATIGYIYLGVSTDLAQRYELKDPVEDLVLFDFGTTGTRMSLLFSNSTSIRKAFIHLLENYRGVCGVFNWEDGGGEVFWLKGRHLSKYIGDAYQLPGEIEEILRKGW